MVSQMTPNEDFYKVCEEGYTGANTIFTNSVHEIMFNIKNQPFFEWPRPMGDNPTTRNNKLSFLIIRTMVTEQITAKL